MKMLLWALRMLLWSLWLLCWALGIVASGGREGSFLGERTAARFAAFIDSLRV